MNKPFPNFIKAFEHTLHAEWLDIHTYGSHWLLSVMKPKDVDHIEYQMRNQCLPKSWEELKTLFLTTFQSGGDISFLIKK